MWATESSENWVFMGNFFCVSIIQDYLNGNFLIIFVKCDFCRLERTIWTESDAIKITCELKKTFGRYIRISTDCNLQ